MPHADPRESFQTAVHHLFRHLDDAAALQRNPLVTRYFDSSRGGITPKHYRATLEVILGSIASCAKRCLDADIAAKNAEIGYRQFEIIQRTYVQRKPPATVAAELGISVRQYYRDRSLICTRIAKIVQAEQPSNLPPAYSLFDPLRFRRDKAMARADAGDYDGALRDLQDICKAASCAQNKIEALCNCGAIEIERGSFTSARAFLSHALNLLEANVSALPPVSGAASQAHLNLVSAKLAWETADCKRARTLTERARSKIEPIQASAGGRLSALYAAILLQCVNHDALLGDFSGAYANLAHVDDVSRTRLDASSSQRIDVLQAQAELDLTATRPNSGSTSTLRERRLREALELARTSRSLSRVISAETELASRFICSEGNAKALQTARNLLDMAENLGNWQIVASTARAMADILSSSGLWKAVPYFLSRAEQHAFQGGIDWILIMHLKASYYLRKGQALLAWQCAQGAYAASARLESPRLVAGMLRGLAQAAHACNRQGDAVDYICKAVSIVEQHGSAWSCMWTYRSAAAITGDIKFEKAAENYRALLTA